MEKSIHDELAAKKRVIDYKKPWFLKTLDLMRRNDVKGETFTDFGAGKGEFIKLVKERNYFTNFQAVDYSDTNIATLEEDNTKAYKINLEEIDDFDPAKISKSDGIVALELIEHVFNLDDLFSFFNKISNPKAKLIISTPNTGSLMHKIFYCLRGYPFGENHHIRFLTLRKLEQYAFFNGFKIKSTNNFKIFGLDMLKRGLGLRSKLILFPIAAILNLFILAIDYLTFHKLNFTKTNLVVLFERMDLSPVGIEKHNFENNFNNLSDQEKEKWQKEIQKFVKRNDLKEHIEFRDYIKKIILS